MVLIQDKEGKTSSFTTLTKLINEFKDKGVSKGSYYYIAMKLRSAKKGEWAKYKNFKLIRV